MLSKNLIFYLCYLFNFIYINIQFYMETPILYGFTDAEYTFCYIRTSGTHTISNPRVHILHFK